jgi:hypothetical protein
MRLGHKSEDVYPTDTESGHIPLRTAEEKVQFRDSI